MRRRCRPVDRGRRRPGPPARALPLARHDAVDPAPVERAVLEHELVVLAVRAAAVRLHPVPDLDVVPRGLPGLQSEQHVVDRAAHGAARLPDRDEHVHDIPAVAHRRHTLEQLVFGVSVQRNGHHAPARVAVEVQVHLRHAQAERTRQHAERPEVPVHGEVDPGAEPRARPGQRLDLRPRAPVVAELELERRDRQRVDRVRVPRVVEVLDDPQDRRRRLEREVQVHEVVVVEVGRGDVGQRVQRLRRAVPDPHVAVPLGGDQRRLARPRGRHGVLRTTAPFARRFGLRFPPSS